MNHSELIKSLGDECRDLTLLYVEDNLDLAMNTQQTLKPFFKSILYVENGEEGLKAYEVGKFDIVLTDIMMPKLDGCEMSRRIRKINPNQSIVVMSAYEDSEHFMELIEIGINKFIPKPPRLEQLFRFLTLTAIEINNAKKIAALNLEMKHDLAESKEVLRRIIDTVPVRIFWKDRESKYLGCNKLFLKDAGLESRSEIIGKSDYDLCWSNVASEYITDDKYVMESDKEKLNYEETQTTSSGDKIWLSTSKVPLKGEDGEIIGVLGSYLDITQQKEAAEAIKIARDELGYQAEHDSLTGLPNRFLYFDRLNQAIKKTARTDSKIAVIFIDLDRFKEINDSLGHEIGDEVIKILGERLESELRAVDTIARFGGDEFVVLIEDIDDVNAVREVMDKIMLSVQNPFSVKGHQMFVTLSAGISICPNDGNDPKTLLRNADTAMYIAKDEGRNTYQFYTEEMTKKSIYQMNIAKSIRSAIENREFVLYYQPQINAYTKEICGFEALIRWNNPDYGFISPDIFIPIAEDTGLINKIGDYVFKEATRQVAEWYEKGLNPVRIAINISTIELQIKDYSEHINQILDDAGCKHEWIELEITEGYMMKNPEEAIKILQTIKDSGIHLSIDDFGTGYSSLSYLKRLPVHKLKIDQSFVQDLPDDPEDVAIVKSIISLAKTMEFEVIAEGVETLEQQQFLVENGCHEIQGFFNAKPMPAYEAEEFLRNYNKNN